MKPIPASLLFLFFVGAMCSAVKYSHSTPEQEPDLALAASQLSRLAPVVDMGKVEPSVSFATDAPFEITATQDITVTVLKMWSECRSPLDQQFECVDGGRVWRTEWREVVE